MTETGYGTQGLWNKRQWEKHITKGKAGIDRYDQAQYRHRNEWFMKLLERNTIDDNLKWFEFAGAGGYLARMILDKYAVKEYLHTDFLQVCVENARNILHTYKNATVKQLDMANDYNTIELDKFDVIVSTSAGYIFNLRDILKDYAKKGAYVLISYPVGYESRHMMRFPSIYELKHYYGFMEIIDIHQIAYLPQTMKCKLLHKLSHMMNLPLSRLLLSEKYVLLGKIL